MACEQPVTEATIQPMCMHTYAATYFEKCMQCKSHVCCCVSQCQSSSLHTIWTLDKVVAVINVAKAISAVQLTLCLRPQRAYYSQSSSH
jgi:hypothetical protein